MFKIILFLFLSLLTFPLFAKFELNEALEDYRQWKTSNNIINCTVSQNVFYVNDLSKRALEERSEEKAVAVQKMLEGQLLFEIFDQQATQSQAELMLVTAAISNHVITLSSGNEHYEQIHWRWLVYSGKSKDQLEALRRAYDFGRKHAFVYDCLNISSPTHDDHEWINALKQANSLRDLTRPLVHCIGKYEGIFSIYSMREKVNKMNLYLGDMAFDMLYFNINESAIYPQLSLQNKMDYLFKLKNKTTYSHSEQIFLKHLKSSSVNNLSWTPAIEGPRKILTTIKFNHKDIDFVLPPWKDDCSIIAYPEIFVIDRSDQEFLIFTPYWYPLNYYNIEEEQRDKLNETDKKKIQDFVKKKKLISREKGKNFLEFRQGMCDGTITRVNL